MSEVKSLKVRCPRCKELVEYSQENPFRPFCSERCRLIDLGQWASEDYRIPVQNPTEGLSDFQEDDEESRRDF